VVLQLGGWARCKQLLTVKNYDVTKQPTKPDIIIRDNEKGTCTLIDVAFPGERNVIKKPRSF
jgi:hypothetical protein